MASTGVIGEFLPYKKIIEKIPELIKTYLKIKLSTAQMQLWLLTPTKIRYKKFKLENKFVSVAGIAKGSGMIAPNMATMLAFIITDVKISYDILKN